MSSHSDGLGSRNGWNSPDQTNSLLPSIISEYWSNVTVCGPSAAVRPSSAPPPRELAATPAEAAAGLAASPAAAASAVPVSSRRRERPGTSPGSLAGWGGSVGVGIVGTPRGGVVVVLAGRRQ